MCNDLLGRAWGMPLPGPTPPPAPPGAKYGPLPHPPPVPQGALTVDEAWALFGIPQKRGLKADVKARYLAFVAKHHPDKHPDDQVGATAQLARANQAWVLLQKHCRW
jgi:hypothetical protein